jgi:hypothetical protein
MRWTDYQRETCSADLVGRAPEENHDIRIVTPENSVSVEVRPRNWKSYPENRRIMGRQASEMPFARRPQVNARALGLSVALFLSCSITR